ncbi:MAG: 3-oxoacyl-[acyl-carrier-protein] reductase [Rhodospirillales bacterium]|nr:3-oxoacyl-[acyl-carrier-protein] reductase [Rhodospirillales bacterium]
MFDLSGRTALVTGASGGIGGAVARALAAQGARVILSGTRRPALDALAAELGPDAVVVTADLATAEGAKALLAEAEAAAGSVDILVNNAGLARDGLVMRTTDADWQTVIDVNLTAGFRLARGALRGMMKRRWGRIIGISSIIGVTGNAGQAAYSAAKAGMIGMTKSLAKEVASRGITANCIAPGFIETEMTRELAERGKDSVLAAIPAGRFGSGADVAACVVFLASEEAGYVTGQTLHVNGGMAMI